MKDWVNRYLRAGLFALGGAVLGLGYYYLFGCSGNCAITASPWMTMGYMAVIGILLGAVTKKEVA